MKKKFIAVALLGLSLFGFTGCNSVARNFGGTITVDLPAGRKLMEVTWKEDTLWYLTRPMKEDEEAEQLIFQADSNFGIIEGTVILNEYK